MTTIDHKDQPGEYRERVTAEVLAPFGGEPTPVSSREDMVGTWRWRSWLPEKGQVETEYTFLHSGRLGIRRAGNPQYTNHEKDKWRLNRDGTFSFLHWCDAETATIRGQAGHEELRYFLRALPDGRRVLWNGDGSLVMVLEPVKTD